MDSTAMRVHQHGAWFRSRRRAEAVGKSRAGWTTKLHVAVDGIGRLQAWVVSPGQDADISHAPALLSQLRRPGRVLADKAYDCGRFVRAIARRGGRAVIPSRRGRRGRRPLDRRAYAQRNVVERHFARLKQYRRIATRFERTCRSWVGMVMLAEALLFLR